MKLHHECFPCLMDTAVKQVRLATEDEDLQFKILSEFSKFLGSNFSKENTPSKLGSKRNRMIREMTSNPDPYAELKERAIHAARDLKPFAEKIVEEGDGKKDKLKRSLKIVAAANSMEFGVSAHEFNPEFFQSEFEDLLERDLKIDDSSEIVSKILSSDEILYLTDNCGEAVLDQILIEQIRDTGAKLIIGVKSEPAQDDITFQKAKEINLDEFGELVTTGGKVGIFLNDISQKLQKKLENADLIISKGMGNFETISEFEENLKGRLVYLLRAKCNPVATSLGVERGELVIKYL